MPQTRNATRIQQMDVSNKQLKKMADKLSATNDIESAFAILLKDPQFGDARAMEILAAFHSVSGGPDDHSSPPYAAPAGVSPAAAWRGGPVGGASLLELAGNLIENPSDKGALFAFKRGRASQHTVIKGLYEKETEDSENVGSFIHGLEMTLRLISKFPLDIKDRLLQVYSKLARAEAIVHEHEGGLNPTELRMPTPAAKAPKTEPVEEHASLAPAISEMVKDLLTSHTASWLTPLKAQIEEEVQAIKSGQAQAEKMASMADTSSLSAAATSLKVANQALQGKVAGLEEKLEGTTTLHEEQAELIQEAIYEVQTENAKLQRELAEAKTKMEELLRASQVTPPMANANKIDEVEEAIHLKHAELEDQLADAREAREADMQAVEGKMDANMAAITRQIEHLSKEVQTPTRRGIFSSPLGLGTPTARKARTSPSDMPPLPSWSATPAPPGLEQADKPDFEEAWLARPPTGEDGKAARKQLAARLTEDKLVKGLPQLGDATAYGVLRKPMLEDWFLFAEHINSGGERGETALHRALVRYAAEKHSTHGQNQGYWRHLMNAKTVAEFLQELDILFCDRNHTASEMEWAQAKASAKDALDYLTRMRHLLKSDDAIRRGRFNLTQYLAERKDEIALTALAGCRVDDVEAWYDALDSLRAVRSQISPSPAPAPPDTRKRAGLAAADQLLAGFSSSKTKNTSDDSKFEGGALSFDTDLSIGEANTLLQALVEMQRRSDSTHQAVNSLRGEVTRLAAFSAGGGSFTRNEKFAPSAPGGPPKVYDLQAAYDFLGLKTKVPERRGPHANGTHGSECGICSEFFNFKKFESHEILKGQGFPADARPYHNAWKCSKLDKAVLMHAEKMGASSEVANKLLTPVDDPFWKPRGN